MSLRPDAAGDKTDDARLLQRHLVAAGHIPANSALVPLSGGRTNRLWRVRSGQGELVVKLYADTVDNPLFANDPDAEAQMLKHLAGTGLAPKLQATLETNLGHVLLYAHVPGHTWRNDPAPVAKTLAGLHRMPAFEGLPTVPDGSAALTRQTLDTLSRCPGPDAASIRALAPKGSVPPSDARVLLHGDVVPGNLVCSGKGVTLIDWQCPALGDPVHDLASFLSPAMQQAYRGKPLSGSETNAFLAGYDDPETTRRYQELAPWFHWRMAAYCLWRIAQGADDYRFALALELKALKN